MHIVQVQEPSPMHFYIQLSDTDTRSYEDREVPGCNEMMRTNFIVFLFSRVRIILQSAGLDSQTLSELLGPFDDSFGEDGLPHRRRAALPRGFDSA